MKTREGNEMLEAPPRDCFCCAEGDARARGCKAVLSKQVPVLQQVSQRLQACCGAAVQKKRAFQTSLRVFPPLTAKRQQAFRAVCKLACAWHTFLPPVVMYISCFVGPPCMWSPGSYQTFILQSHISISREPAQPRGLGRVPVRLRPVIARSICLLLALCFGPALFLSLC